MQEKEKKCLKETAGAPESRPLSTAIFILPFIHFRDAFQSRCSTAAGSSRQSR